ncbi:MAG: hypothetical protein M1819_005404 [Sarea resinae]|nr:MAG: hypothetical protein M1819_005404 [Sarea resinae]
MPNSFGIGLMPAWTILWSAVLIVFNDAQRDFKRIQRNGKKSPEQDQSHVSDGHVNGLASGAETFDVQDGVSKRKSVETLSKRNLQPAEHGSQNFSSDSETTFSWQRYPEHSFKERLDWVVDAASNMRGIGWNWCSSTLPTFPPWVQSQLRQNGDGGETNLKNRDHRIGVTGNVSYQTRKHLVWTKLGTLALNYLLLDLCKVVMMADPYFWGLMDRPPPSYLPDYISTSTTLLRSYRLLISLTGILSALQALFSLGPLIFSGLLGPSVIGTRGEPWLFPDIYGSFSANIFNKGLGGWWGGWWHQSFRFAFEAPSKWLLEKTGIERTSNVGKVLQLVLAFSLSGFLHACASYTQAGPSEPLKGAFLFFFLQPYGIILQITLAQLLKYYGIRDRTPKPLRQAVNFVYVHMWMYYTAPLLTDDFAKGGLWLSEPVPVSLVRGLGFGGPGEGWWCLGWTSTWPRWVRGARWWNVGFAI